MLWCLLFLCSYPLISSAAPRFPYKRTCASTSLRFDVSGLQCVPCGVNEVSNDGKTCDCKAGYAKSAVSNINTLVFGTCKSCADLNMAVSESGRYCVKCDSTTTMLDTKTGKCRCRSPDNAVLSETDETGALRPQGTTCTKCATDAYAATSNECRRCAYPYVYSSSKKRCTCPPKNGTVDNYPSSLAEESVCVDGTSADALTEVAKELRVSINRPFRHTFNDVISAAGGGRSVGSSGTVSVDNAAALVNFLSNATVMCYAEGSSEACNSLANLCVLSMFQRESNPCKIYDALVELRSSQQYWSQEIKPKVGWSYTLPWLYYEERPRAALYSNDAETPVSFQQASGKVQILKFVLSAYALDGTWLGMNNASLPMMQMC